jgi:hypothetical protein
VASGRVDVFRNVACALRSGGSDGPKGRPDRRPDSFSRRRERPPTAPSTKPSFSTSATTLEALQGFLFRKKDIVIAATDPAKNLFLLANQIPFVLNDGDVPIRRGRRPRRGSPGADLHSRHRPGVSPEPPGRREGARARRQERLPGCGCDDARKDGYRRPQRGRGLLLLAIQGHGERERGVLRRGRHAGDRGPDQRRHCHLHSEHQPQEV